MTLQFKKNIPLEETLVFEEIYPENLQMDLETKQELLDEGALFLYVIDKETGKLIGETYSIPLDNMKDWDVDEHQPEDGLENWYGKNAVYVYSTTILPEYQGKKLGEILKAYFLGMAESQFDYVVGHARQGASIHLNKKFGAKVEQPFDNWYQTGETFYLYSLKLKE